MIRDSVIDWQELSALYEQADGLDETARAALLDRLGVQKHRLLSQLERMLSARDRIARSSFLETLPSLERSPAVVPSELGEGDRIGAYRLIRPIGSGGMAEVWLAERADGAFDRQVAMKLLFKQPTRSQRERFVARFERERDFLAALHHPHIAALHDAGITPGGQPWLALEYVQGDPITSWCDRKELTLKERVAIFRQVLEAVEHAHANLIIHRDLKPSNIMVTDAGEVKLLDFGIAKLIEPEGGALEASDLTREGGRPLTLQYASPEQLSGRPLTTTSDVYSLGIVLYELLCGARPFDDGQTRSAAQLESAILAGDVVPPSRRVTAAAATSRRTSDTALVRALAGDLDAVAAKALQAETARRYPSAEALRLDLDRWRDGRPVGAQPPTIAYRARKFYLRHRLGVWSGGLALSSILALGIATVVAGLKAQSESARAIASRDFVVDLFRITDPENSRGRDMSPRGLLQAGRKRALEALASQPALQADVLRQIGVMQIYAGDYKGADETLSQAAAMFARQGPLRDWMLTQIEIAENANYLGDVKRAEQSIGLTAPRIEAFAEDTALMAKYWQVKGFISRALRDHASAADQLTKAIALSTKAQGPSHVDTIDAMRDLAATYGEMGRFAEAYSLLEDAARRARENFAVGPRDVLAIDADMLITAIKAGRFAVTLDPLQKLLTRCDVELGSDADHCVILTLWLAGLSLRLEEPDTSHALIPRLLATAANDASPLQQSASANYAVEVLANENRLQDHGDLLAQVRRIAVTEALPPRTRSQAFLAMAIAELRSENLAAAIDASQAAIDLQSSLTHPDIDMLAKARLVRGLTRHRQAAFEPALDDIDRAITEFGRALGADHPLVALYRCNRAAVLRDLKRRDDAVQSLESSLHIVSKSFGDAPVVHRVQALLAELRAEPQNASRQSNVFVPFL